MSWILWIAACLIWISVPSAASPDSPKLTEYVQSRSKPSMTKPLHSEKSKDGTRLEIYRLETGAWRSAAEVQPHTWQHELQVIYPRKRQCPYFFLYISGGRLNSDERRPPHPLVQNIAQKPACMSAQLNLVPNQGLTFPGDEKPRFEDNIIAFTMQRYLKTNDQTWLALFPMVRAVASAMDFLELLTPSEPTSKNAGFVLSGQSKRGWTSWLTAAVDTRVKAIVPIVIDFLNTRTSLKHHHQVYNSWSPPLKDYENQGILAALDTPAMTQLLKILDPLSYKEQLRLPKFVINAANDQFFTPDSSSFYFDALQGAKALLYVPNAGHHIDENPTYREAVPAFLSRVIAQQEIPTIRAKLGREELRFETSQTPKTVRLWEAHNPKARDFRLAEKYPAYTSRTLTKQEWKSGRVKLVAKKPGYYATFFELEFADGLKISSEVFMLN